MVRGVIVCTTPACSSPTPWLQDLCMQSCHVVHTLLTFLLNCSKSSCSNTTKLPPDIYNEQNITAGIHSELTKHKHKLDNAKKSSPLIDWPQSTSCQLFDGSTPSEPWNELKWLCREVSGLVITITLLNAWVLIAAIMLLSYNPNWWMYSISEVFKTLIYIPVKPYFKEFTGAVW